MTGGTAERWPEADGRTQPALPVDDRTASCMDREGRLGLHVLTDRALSCGRTDAAVAAAALTGGASVIQLRGKNDAGAALVQTGHVLRAITRAHGGLLIVNDRVDVALVVDADGAHVGQDDLPAREARRLLGAWRLLGVSARTVEEARRAEQDGADYVGFGPVFPTGTKRDAGPARGLDELRKVCRALTIPVVAIGGITRRNAAEAIAAGASGLAVVSAVVGAEDVAGEARFFRDVISRNGGDARPLHVSPSAEG